MERGADPETACAAGKTALHYAAEVCTLLLLDAFSLTALLGPCDNRKLRTRAAHSCLMLSRICIGGRPTRCDGAAAGKLPPPRRRGQ